MMGGSEPVPDRGSEAPRRRSGWTAWLGRLYAHTPGAEALYQWVAPMGFAARDRYLTITRLSGPTRYRDESGSMMVADAAESPTGVDELASQFFAGEPKREALGKMRPGDIVRGGFDGHQPFDLAIVRVDRFRALRAFEGGFLACPEWIGTQAPVPDSVASIWRRPHDHGLRSDLRRIEREGLSYRVSRDAATFTSFYRDSYLTFVRERHGDRAVPRTEPVLRRAFQRGGILWILRDGVRLAGAIFAIEGDVLKLMVLGANRDNDGTIDGSVIAAIYRYGLEHARQIGCTKVDFGGSRPSLMDGGMRYKRKWGAALASKPDNYHHLMVRWSRYNDRVAEFLSRVPLIFHEGKGFSAVTALPPGTPATDEALKKTHRTLMMRGLRRLYITSDDRHEPLREAAVADAEVVHGAPTVLEAGT